MKVSHNTISEGYSLSTPYDCYALLYWLAHSLDKFSLDIGIERDDTVSLVETLVKGFEDHCTFTTPSVVNLTVRLLTISEEVSMKAMFWLMKAKFLPAVENLHLGFIVMSADLTLSFCNHSSVHFQKKVSAGSFVL